MSIYTWRKFEKRADRTAIAAARAVEVAASKRQWVSEQPDEYKLIPVGTGRDYALVDNDMFDELKVFNWSFQHGYVRNRCAGRMARMVMLYKLGRELKPSEHVDHINRNKLDNRASNLRLASCSENSRNTVPKHKSSSGYRGVSKTVDGRYQARISIEMQTVYLGRYTTAREAAYVYDQVNIQIHGRYGIRNFL